MKFHLLEDRFFEKKRQKNFYLLEDADRIHESRQKFEKIRKFQNSESDEIRSPEAVERYKEAETEFGRPVPPLYWAS